MKTITNLVVPEVGVMKGHMFMLSKTSLWCEVSDNGEVCNKLVMGLQNGGRYIF
jgi:hypothetical protein